MNHQFATITGFVNSLDVGLRLSRDYWVSGDFLVIELGMLRPVNTGEASITVLWPRLRRGQPRPHCPDHVHAIVLARLRPQHEWWMEAVGQLRPGQYSVYHLCVYSRGTMWRHHSTPWCSQQRTDWRICEMFIFAKWQSIRWLSGSELEFHWFPVKFSVISVKIEAASVTDKTEIEGH